MVFDGFDILLPFDLMGGEKVDAVLEVDFGQRLGQNDFTVLLHFFTNGENFFQSVFPPGFLPGGLFEKLQHHQIGFKISFEKTGKQFQFPNPDEVI